MEKIRYFLQNVPFSKKCNIPEPTSKLHLPSYKEFIKGIVRGSC